MSSSRAEPMSAGAASPAVVRPVVIRRSRDLEDWERAPLRELGQVLQDARHAAGLSLEDLGPVVGSKDSLEAIENGAGRTRAGRLRPWLAHLGVDPEPIIAKYIAVIAPPSPSGRQAWRPVAPVAHRWRNRGRVMPTRARRSQAASRICTDNPLPKAWNAASN